MLFTSEIDVKQTFFEIKMIDYLDRNSKSNLLYASFIRVSFILRVNHCIEEKNSATLMGLIKTIPLRNLFLNQII